jgi:hypothetical protein
MSILRAAYATRNGPQRFPVAPANPGLLRNPNAQLARNRMSEFVSEQRKDGCRNNTSLAYDPRELEFRQFCDYLKRCTGLCFIQISGRKNLLVQRKLPTEGTREMTATPRKGSGQKETPKRRRKRRIQTSIINCLEHLKRVVLFWISRRQRIPSVQLLSVRTSLSSN